jgi:hypothetical protein
MAHQPAHHVRDLGEILLGDGEGHGGTQGEAGLPARLTDHRREFLPQRHQLQLRLRRLVAVPPALGYVDVDRDLGQAPLGHQPLEEAWLAAEVVAVGHHHGDDADRPRVAQDLSQLLDRPEGHLAVGDLDVALGAQPAAELVELPQDGRGGQGGDLVRLVAEIAAGAGEVAAGLDADGGAAPGRLLAQSLSGEAEGGIEPRPALRQQCPFLGSGGVPEETPDPPE